MTEQHVEFENATKTKTYKVKVHQTFHIRNLTRAISLLENIASIIKKDINLYAPHNNIVSPMENDAFNIYIWSSPYGEKVKNLSRKEFIFEIPIFVDGYYDVHTHDSFSYTGLGIDIADGNFSVAELINKHHLYIHFDVLHYECSASINVFARILDEAVSILES